VDRVVGIYVHGGLRVGGLVILDNRSLYTADRRLHTSTTSCIDRDGARQIFDYSTEPPRSYELELRDFIDCIKRGKQPMASGHDGMKVIEMVDGIYKSSKSGRITSLVR
jgi:predicted dehydrogenase